MGIDDSPLVGALFIFAIKTDSLMKEVIAMSNKVIKILSIVTTAAGIVVSVVADVVNSKKLDNTIAEKVAEAVAKIEK